MAVATQAFLLGREGEGEKEKSAENLSSGKNFPYLGKATHAGLGSTGSFKEDEPKEINTETLYN